MGSRSDYRLGSLATQLAVLFLAWTFAQASFAQGGAATGYEPPASPPSTGMSAPVPGADALAPANYATASGQGTSLSSNYTPGPAAVATTSKYQQLPLSLFDARARLQELSQMAEGSRPQAAQQSVNRFSEWLGDMIDAHNKMANVFAKHDNMRSESQTERQSAAKFAQVRNQVQLLKADLLMREHRYPEALAPLVDIVIAEPASATGQAAYKKLKELGFSEEAPVLPKSELQSPAKDAATDKNASGLLPTAATPVKTVGMAVAPAKKAAEKSAGAPLTQAKKAVGKSAAHGKPVNNKAAAAKPVKPKSTKTSQ